MDTTRSPGPTNLRVTLAILGRYEYFRPSSDFPSPIMKRSMVPEGLHRVTIVRTERRLEIQAKSKQSRFSYTLTMTTPFIKIPRVIHGMNLTSELGSEVAPSLCTLVRSGKLAVTGLPPERLLRVDPVGIALRCISPEVHGRLM